MQDVIKVLPKVIGKIRMLTLPAIENVGESDDGLHGQGVTTNISSNRIHIYTRLEISPGLKFLGHSDTLREASNSSDGIYKKGEIQNEQQNRNALEKFHTQ